MPIIRWRPIHELERLIGEAQLQDLAVDIYDEKESIVVEMHIPGVQPDHVDISVEDDRLRVSGSREEDTEVGDRNYFHQEIRRGEFERYVSLPCPVISDQARAEVKGGVLFITLPKRKGAHVSKIQIKNRE
jgi:HSP20 family protein